MKRRRLRVWALLAVLAVLIVTTLLVISLYRPKRSIKLSLTGTPNSSHVARFVVDGKVIEETLTVPTEREFRASQFAFWLVPADAQPEQDRLGVVVSADEEPWLGWASGDQNHGVKGNVTMPSLFWFNRGGAGLAGMAQDEVENVGYVQ